VAIKLAIPKLKPVPSAKDVPGFCAPTSVELKLVLKYASTEPPKVNSFAFSSSLSFSCAKATVVNSAKLDKNKFFTNFVVICRSRPSNSSFSETLRPDIFLIVNRIIKAVTEQKTPAAPTPASCTKNWSKLARAPNIPTARVPHIPQIK